jgi:glucosylceramidase
MSKYLLLFILMIALTVSGFGQSVSVYQTTSDLNQKLQQKTALTFSGSGTGSQTITVDDTKTYQQIDGFGASFTDSSAWLVYTKLTDAQRSDAMQKLFSRDNGIALSFIRQPMGASDLALNFYTYDDMPAGQTDPTLANFSIDHDKAYIIPVLKDALALNPNLKMMANPWSPPAWMKTNNSLIGSPGGNNGSLKSDAYGPLANYFVKYIQAYQAVGIKTDYISMQNEPLYAPPGYTGMLMSTGDQINLLNTYIAPAFATAGIKSKVLIYDHNWDRQDYPQSILANAKARANAAGVAWHHYAGTPSAMSAVHDLYPEMEAWETEASGGTWQTGNVLVQEAQELVNTMRNWGKSYVLWNMALDQDHGPVAKTADGQHGCDTCRGIITVNWDKTGGSGASTVTQELDYYVLGHASKFLQTGAYRVYSDENVPAGLYDVAFRNPDGSIVVYAVNSGSSDVTFNVKFHSQFFTATLTAGSIATYVWTPTTTPAVSLSHQPNGISIAAGQTGTIDIAAQPVNGSTPKVTFSCAVTDLSGAATTKASCSLVPANLTFADGSPQSTSLTVTTTKTTGKLKHRPFGWLAGLSSVAVLGGVLCGTPGRRRGATMGLMALAVVIATVSCGGGGGGGGVIPPPGGGGGGGTTTAATYLVNVTATPDAGATTSISIQTLVN